MIVDHLLTLLARTISEDRRSNAISGLSDDETEAIASEMEHEGPGHGLTPEICANSINNAPSPSHQSNVLITSSPSARGSPQSPRRGAIAP